MLAVMRSTRGEPQQIGCRAKMGASSSNMGSAPMRADTRTLQFDDASQKRATKLHRFSSFFQLIQALIQ